MSGGEERQARPSPRLARGLALAASALLALAILLAPWYGLGAYEPTGWEASWWLRVACLLAVASVALLRLGRGALVPAALACALVGARVLLPPDFGLDFDGLEVPVERRWGAWAGLAAAALALLAPALPARRARRVP